MRFEYVPYGGDRWTIYRPSLPITFRNAGKSFPVGNALVDTGADVTLLPMEMAKHLGVELVSEEGIDVGSAGGGHFTAVPSATAIECSIEGDGFRPLRWKSVVYFAPRQQTVLLGHRGCLEHLDVCFHGPDRSLEVLKVYS
jgi:predicted aspartyl protease